MQQMQFPPEKFQSTGKQIEAEVKKYIDEAFPIVRDRAIKLAPSTIGVALETKLSEDELKQLLAWLESPVSKKFQQVDRRGRPGLRATGVARSGASRAAQGGRARRARPRHPRRAAASRRGAAGICIGRRQRADRVGAAREAAEQVVAGWSNACSRPA